MRAAIYSSSAWAVWSDSFLYEDHRHRGSRYHNALLMEKSTQILCKFIDDLFGSIDKHEHQCVFFRVAAIFVKVSSADFLNFD